RRLGEAEQDLRRALAEAEELARENSAGECQSELAGTLDNLCEVLKQTGQLREAEKGYRRAKAIQERLVADFPNVANYQSVLGVICHHYAALLESLGKPAEARILYTQAIAQQKSSGHLHNHYLGRAGNEELLGEHAGAAQAVADLVRLAPDDILRHRQAAEHLRRCIELAASD